MAYKNSEISLTVRMNPEKAARMLLSAFRKAGGKAEAAAAALSITRRTFDRMARQLKDVSVPLPGGELSASLEEAMLQARAKTRAA